MFGSSPHCGLYMMMLLGIGTMKYSDLIGAE